MRINEIDGMSLIIHNEKVSAEAICIAGAACTTKGS